MFISKGLNKDNKTLRLNNNLITNLNGITFLTGLLIERFDISYNRITDINELLKMKQWTSLNAINV